MVDSGFGAAGSAGKASSLLLVAGRLAEAAGAAVVRAGWLGRAGEEMPPIHEGCGGLDAVAALGSAGNIADGGAAVREAAIHVAPGTGRAAGTEVGVGMSAALPRRVLLLSFKTLVVCFCAAAVVGCVAATRPRPLPNR